MRFGPKYRNVCASVVASRSVINWMTWSRHFSVYLESSIKFKCCFGKNKVRFYQAFNNIFGKIGRNASEEVLFSLIKSKCLPVLLYGIEVCSMSPINAANGSHCSSSLIKYHLKYSMRCQKTHTQKSVSILASNHWKR